MDIKLSAMRVRPNKKSFKQRVIYKLMAHRYRHAGYSGGDRPPVVEGWLDLKLFSLEQFLRGQVIQNGRKLPKWYTEYDKSGISAPGEYTNNFNRERVEKGDRVVHPYPPIDISQVLDDDKAMESFFKKEAESPKKTAKPKKKAAPKKVKKHARTRS